MEKRIRKFERKYMFNEKNFKLQIDLDQINGISDLWMYEDLDVPFVFSITNKRVHRDELFDQISGMEDRTHEYALKNDLNLVVSTIMENGFYEVIEADDDVINKILREEMEG